MADWIGRVWETNKVSGLFSGAGFWTGRMWGAPGIQGTPPTVDSFNPALATAILPAQTLSFRVTLEATAQRVLVLVQFTQLEVYEVAHDGDAFSQAYPAAQGNVRTLNGNLIDFTILRREGWPASPRVIPVAIDSNGNLNPITSVTYAWTLV